MTGQPSLYRRTIAALDARPKEWAVTVVTDEEPPRVLATRDGAGDTAVVVALDTLARDRAEERPKLRQNGNPHRLKALVPGDLLSEEAGWVSDPDLPFSRRHG